MPAVRWKVVPRVSRSVPAGTVRNRRDRHEYAGVTLGVLTWRLELAPGESREVHFGFRVELAKGVELTGWRE